MLYEDKNLTNLRTSMGEFGGSKGGFVREGGGQAVVVTTPLFALNFCIKSCIVNPSGCAICSNFLLRFTVTCKEQYYNLNTVNAKNTSIERTRISENKSTYLRKLFGLSHKLVICKKGFRLP